MIPTNANQGADTTFDEKVAHLAFLRSQSCDEWPTRDRILLEASRLIATRGFHGATTRDIAEGVGIKQPSMFNHFASKQAILEELLLFDLTIPAERAESWSFDSHPPAVRLYSYAEWDMRWYLEMPYDLRGMHEDLVSLPGLETFQQSLDRWNEAINRILDHGVATGEFRADAAPFVPTLLEAMSWEFVRSAHVETASEAKPKAATDGASFVLRALLTDPMQLPAIREQAKLADRLVA